MTSGMTPKNLLYRIEHEDGVGIWSNFRERVLDRTPHRIRRLVEEHFHVFPSPCDDDLLKSMWMSIFPNRMDYRFAFNSTDCVEEFLVPSVRSVLKKIGVNILVVETQGEGSFYKGQYQSVFLPGKCSVIYKTKLENFGYLKKYHDFYRQRA